MSRRRIALAFALALYGEGKPGAARVRSNEEGMETLAALTRRRLRIGGRSLYGPWGVGPRQHMSVGTGLLRGVRV